MRRMGCWYSQWCDVRSLKGSVMGHTYYFPVSMVGTVLESVTVSICLADKFDKVPINKIIMTETSFYLQITCGNRWSPEAGEHEEEDGLCQP